MSRPQTKDYLLNAAGASFDKLMELISASGEDVMRAEFSFNKDTAGKEAHWRRDNNMRDVLTHLYEWHVLALTWIGANMKGETKPFLPAPYTWKTYVDMNVNFWEKHQSTSYNEALAMLMKSHQEMIELISTFSNEELFLKRYYTWTGTTSLGSYCTSATSSHYDWAIKKVKKHIKALK